MVPRLAEKEDVETMEKKRRFCLIALILASLLAVSSTSLMAEKPGHFGCPVKLLNLETGYILGRGGNVQIGLGQSGFGEADRMQLTTDVLLDLLTFLNFQVKLGLLEDKGPMPALAAGFAYYNLVSSQYIVDTAIKEGFADTDMDMSSGLEIYYFFASMSKRLNERARVHAGYQYRYLTGYVSSDKPIELASDEDTVSVFLSVDQNTVHRSLLGAFDVDLVDRLKVILELGYDFSYEHARGGVGVRLALLNSFTLQVGALWPGIKIGEDFELPVLPNVSMLWRF